MTTITHLECSRCGKLRDAGQVHGVCECGGPLLVRYDLAQVRDNWNREWLGHAPTTMWRYAALLPVSKPSSIVSLGEGMTPLIRLRGTARRAGFDDLWLKDEGVNPTGTFKARGLSCAVSMAAELGLRKLAIPSAGNAAGALAAYAAAAGLEAHVFMPRDVPRANFIECAAAGAHVTLLDGSISDCAEAVTARAASEGWFTVSTLREPYRIEGKKTIGFEIAEQLRWALPDVIVCPTGGGTGLIGMWKAFEEMEALGWVPAKRPRMIAVQAEGCRPLVEAFRSGERECRFRTNAHTVASGLRVPKPLGDSLILDILRRSGGTAVSVTDDALLDAGIQLASDDGLFAAPEGAACVAALEELLRDGLVGTGEKIVILNTGAGVKYLEAYSTRFQRLGAGEQDKLGGLITPR